MNQRHFVVATAGHVDHGKSAIVKALTGTDPDRLPEEKAREITIDLGFAHLELTVSSFDPNTGKSGIGPWPMSHRPAADATTSPPPVNQTQTTVSISIIDVPGHEDFVRNMIAGVGSIDLALLVVAADDGWMPQTEEHLQILSYLGISQIVVAINKTDIVRPNPAITQVQDQLRNTEFRTAPIIPISARSGVGLDELKRALVRSLCQTTPRRDMRKPRLFIDRAFNLSGIGLVVTGTLNGGTISSGQQVFLQPGNFKTRIRSLQTHKTGLSDAQPGMRVGANLVELPKAAATQDLHRGYSLTTNEIEPTTTLDVVVQRSPRLQPTSPAGRSLKNGSGVYVQYGTGRIPATVVFPNRNTLEVGESDIGQLRLASPVAAFVGDRFVIRDGAEQQTIAGGIILDTNSSPRSFRTAAQQRLLGTRASHPDNLHGYVESELIRRGPIHVQSLLPNSNFSAAEIANALDDLAKSGRVVRCGDIAADANSWQRIRQRAVDLIEGRHERMPQLDGVALTELRAALPELSSEVVEALVMQLCETGFVRHGSIVARASHRSTLPEPLEQSAKQILAALLEKPLDPPARTRLALDPNRQQAVRYLIEHGQIVDLGADLLLSGEAFTRAREAVVRFISANGSATVSQLREALQTSRRVAVPLLERLDRERVTRRVGDRRVLTNHKPSAE